MPRNCPPLSILLLTVCYIAATSSMATEARLKKDENEKALYKKLNYKDYLRKMSNILGDQMVIRSMVLEKEFPQLTPNMCGDKVCATYMFEVANHFVGNMNLSSLPTVFLVAGFSGKETMGPAILLNMLLMILKNHTSEREWFRILNIMRIVVIPVINLQGLYSKKSTETRKYNGKNIEIEPKHDFNYKAKEYCFESFTSQVLNLLHSKYLFTSGLVLSGGEHKIIYPKMTSLIIGQSGSADTIAFEQVSKNLANIFNMHRHPDSPEITPFESDSDYDSKNEVGYSEYAICASSAAKLLSTKCIRKGDPFTKVYQPSTAHSHRSFVLEVSVGKGFSQPEDQMGNEVYTVDEEADDAKPGYVSAAILMIRQFLEFNRPFIMVPSIDISKGSEHDIFGNTFDFNFKVKGCLNSEKVELLSPTASKTELIKKPPKEIYSSMSSTMTLKTLFNKNNGIKGDEYQNVVFKFECDDQFLEWETSNLPRQSHFVRAKADPKYQVSRGKDSIKSININHFQIENLQPVRMKKYLIFSKRVGLAQLYYDFSTIFQVEKFFPVKLNYDSTDMTISLQVMQDMIPDTVMKTLSPNYSSHIELLNQRKDAGNNGELVKQLGALKKDFRDLEMRIFMKNKQYVPDYSPKKDKHGHLEHITEEDWHKIFRIKNLDERIYDNANSVTIISIKQKQRMLPSIFVDMIGHKAMITIYNTKQAEHNSDPENSIMNTFKKKLSGASDVMIRGNLVVNDPHVISFTKRDIADPNFPYFPIYSDFKKFNPNGYLKFPSGGLTCSSISPSIQINPIQLMDMMVEKNQGDYTRNTEFYAVNFFKKSSGGDTGNIIFYTNTPKPSEFYILTNKNQDIVLSRTKKDVFTKSLSGVVERALTVFEAEVPVDDLKILTDYILFYESVDGKTKFKQAKPVFDCFALKNISKFDIQSLYKSYLVLFRNGMLIRNELHEDNKGAAVRKQIFSVLTSPIFLGVASTLVFVLLFLCIYKLSTKLMDKEHGQEDQASDLTEEFEKDGAGSGRVEDIVPA